MRRHTWSLPTPWHSWTASRSRRVSKTGRDMRFTRGFAGVGSALAAWVGYVADGERDASAAGTVLGRWPTASSGVDDEHRRRRVADVLDVVRHGRVPGEVVAWPQLDRVVA